MSDDWRARTGDYAATRDGIVHVVHKDLYGGTTTRCRDTHYVSLAKTPRAATCLFCVTYAEAGRP